MATNYTGHYGLCLWEPGDSFIRSEFNADNTKVDAALHGKAEQAALNGLTQTVNGKADQSALNALTTVVNGKADQAALNNLTSAVNGKGQIKAGIYCGNGSASQSVSVGFYPQAVLVEQVNGNRSYSSSYGIIGGMAVRGGSLEQKNYALLSVTSTGFTVYSRTEFTGELNGAGVIYYYVAFG